MSKHPLSTFAVPLLSLMFTVGVFAVVPTLVHAQNSPPPSTGNPTGPANQVPPGNPVPPGNQVPPPDPKTYLTDLYYWFLGVVGVSALFAIVFGGVLYMFSGTNLTKTEQARSWIANGIYGIIIAAFSYILLYVINPDLVTKGFDIQKIVDDALKNVPK